MKHIHLFREKHMLLIKVVIFLMRDSRILIKAHWSYYSTQSLYL